MTNSEARRSMRHHAGPWWLGLRSAYGNSVPVWVCARGAAPTRRERNRAIHAALRLAKANARALRAAGV